MVSWSRRFVVVLTCGAFPMTDTDGYPRTPMNECHEAGGLPPGARLLVLAREACRKEAGCHGARRVGPESSMT
jgi:hypothetical protein